MARPRGYQEAYGNRALRQLREWAGLSPAELATAVQALGGKLSEQHVRNIEHEPKKASGKRVYPSQTLVDLMLAALRSDRDTLERVRTDIAAGEPHPEPARAFLTASPSLASLTSDETQEPETLVAFLASAPPAPEVGATWSAPVSAGAPESLPVRSRRRSLSAAAPPAASYFGSTQNLGAAAATPRRSTRPAPPAPPSTVEAAAEFVAVYEQLSDEDRHRLLGRTRQMLHAAQLRRADAGVTASQLLAEAEAARERAGDYAFFDVPASESMKLDRAVASLADADASRVKALLVALAGSGRTGRHVAAGLLAMLDDRPDFEELHAPELDGLY